jgi:hypothetical protein
MKDRLPQLAVSYDENIPEEILAKFRSSVADHRLDFRVESHPAPGPQAGLEWLLPTAVVVFLGKAYFDAFLKEAGKDHYHLLKSGISWLWRSLANRDRKTNFQRVTAGGKVIDDKYSLALSVVAEANGGYRFKLLIEDSVGEEQFDTAMRLFLEFLEAYHADRLDAATAKALSEGRVVARTILIAYDAEQGCLCVVDPITKRNKGA